MSTFSIIGGIIGIVLGFFLTWKAYAIFKKIFVNKLLIIDSIDSKGSLGYFLTIDSANGLANRINR